MARSTLGPKSSAGQLWKEVERLRARADDEAVEELTSELERARARESQLLTELAASRALAEQAGIAEESFAGKPALFKLRRSWSLFAEAVLRLPMVRSEQGMEGVRTVVAGKLIADLELFELDAPRGPIEADARDFLRRNMTHPGFLAALSASGPAADSARSTFLAQVVRTYFRPAVWRIYEKASDEGIRDGLGTVYK